MIKRDQETKKIGKKVGKEYGVKKMKDDLSSIIESEITAIRNIPITNKYEDAIDILEHIIHTHRGKLITSGMGKAGHIAHNIACMFSSTGSPSVFLHPAEAQHGDLGIIGPHDALLCLSNSGETREILELIHLTKRMHGEEIPILAITSHVDSELGRLSDVVLDTGPVDEVCPLGLCPTTSTTVMSVIGDLLIVSLMKRIGLTREQYAARHHGGYLGEKSRMP